MKKIIHIDNSEFFRKLVKAYVQEEGFEIESFESAQDASIALSSGIVDMVIMGLTFADIEGEEFLDRILESFTGPVIVISSSVAEVKKEKDLIVKGATDAFDKSGPWKERLKPHLSALKRQ